MAFGEFIPKQPVNKEALRVSTKVEHAPMKGAQGEDSPSAVEGVISASDRGTKEELMGAVTFMMDKAGIPSEAVAELEGDQERIDRLNTLAADYLESLTKIDLKKQAAIVKQVQQLFG